MGKLIMDDDKQQYFQEVREQFFDIYKMILQQREAYFQDEQQIEDCYFALVKLQNVSAVFDEKAFYRFALMMLKMFEQESRPKLKKGQEAALLNGLTSLLGVLHGKKSKSEFLLHTSKLLQSRQSRWASLEASGSALKQAMADLKQAFFQDARHVQALYHMAADLQKQSRRSGEKTLSAIAAFLLHQFQSSTAVKSGREAAMVRGLGAALPLLSNKQSGSGALVFVVLGAPKPAVFLKRLGEKSVYGFVYSEPLDITCLQDMQPDMIALRNSSTRSAAFIEQCRRNPELKEAVILAAADGTDENYLALLESGADSVLSEPVSDRVLLACGARLLEKAAGPAPQAAVFSEQKREWAALLEKEWERFVRFGSEFCIVSIQLAGPDEKISSRLQRAFKSILRKYDDIKQIGPGHIVALLPKTSLVSGEIVASRFWKLIESQASAGVMESERTFGSGKNMMALLMEKMKAEPASGEVAVFPLQEPALPQRKKTIKVLLIDDDPLSASFISNYLEGDQWKVETCTDTAGAMKHVWLFRPDVVLCETKMRDLDGFLLCRQIRQQPELAGLTFFFLTGQSLAHHQLRAYEAGADDYLVKPFSIEALQAKIKRAVN